MHNDRYVVIRTLGLLFQGMILLYSIYLELIAVRSGWQRLVWFAYLTHLNLLIVFLYESRAWFYVIRTKTTDRELFCVLRDMAVTLSVTVFILYWTLDRSATLFNGILFHGVNMVLLVSEVIVLKQSYVPTLLSWRYFAPLLFAFVYLPTEALLTKMGMVNSHGQPIYQALPWNTDWTVALKWSIVGVLLIASVPLVLRKINKFVCRL